MGKESRRKNKADGRPSKPVAAPETAGALSVADYFELAAFGLLALVVGAMPFVFSKITKSNFILPKQILFEPIAWLMLFLWLTASALRGSWSVVRSPLYSSVALFFGVLTLSLIGAVPAYETGLEYRAWMIGGVAFFLAANLVTTRTRLIIVLVAASISGALQAVWGIVQYLGTDPILGIGGAAIGTTGNSNYLGALLAMFFFPLMSVGLYAFGKIQGVGMKAAVAVASAFVGIVYLVALLYSDCQGAYIGFGVAFVAYAAALAYKAGFDFKKAIRGGMATVAVAAIFLAASWIVSGKNPARFLNLGPLATKGRVLMWHAAALMVKDYPVLGVGIGAYPYHYLDYLAKSFEGRDIKPILGLIQYDEKPHSAYFQIWAETGTAGLVSFVLVAGLFFYSIARDLRDTNNRDDTLALLGVAGCQLAFLTTMGVSSLTAISPFREFCWMFFGLYAGWRASVGMASKFDWKPAGASKFDWKPAGALKAVASSMAVIAIIGAASGADRSLKQYTANVLWERGINASDEGNDALSIEYYSSALEMTPFDHKLLFYRGSMYLKVAEDVRGPDKKALLDLGMADLVVAAEGYSDVNLYSNLAKTYRDLDDYVNAVKWYERAAKTGLHYGTAHSNLGAAYLAMGRPEDARRALVESLAVDPSNTWSLFNLGLVELTMKNSARAVEIFEKYIEFVPSSSDGRNNLGLALIESGDATRALKVLREAEAIRPDSVRALNNMGLAYSKLGDNAKAAEMYRRVLELDPDNETAKKRLAKLPE